MLYNVKVSISHVKCFYQIEGMKRILQSYSIERFNFNRAIAFFLYRRQFRPRHSALFKQSIFCRGSLLYAESLYSYFLLNMCVALAKFTNLQYNAYDH